MSPDLLDGERLAFQQSLFASGPVALREGDWARTELDTCCWLEHRPGARTW